MRSSKTWSIAALIVTLSLLLALGAATVIIDPFFHYHAPLKGLSYPINNQRYQNDGIIRHFSYDAIITGTSMSENFKSSEFDSLFGVRSIKVPFFGASYKEIGDNLKKAAEVNPEITTVVWGLDYNRLMLDKDAMEYDVAFYPDYLYDNCPLNDVEYIFNKTVFFNNTWRAVGYTLSGEQTTSFDEYSNWMWQQFMFGRKGIAAEYVRPEKAAVKQAFSAGDEKKLRENLGANVIALAQANPQIDFHLFFPPYSIYYWDSLHQEGTLERQLDAEKLAIELLLEQENIYLYSFFDNFELVCNAGNYKDIAHYGQKTNTQLLIWMHDGEHRLTKENYHAYCDRTRAFYTGYDYETLYTELVGYRP